MSNIGKKCVHIPSGVPGIIKMELDTFDPPQYGVYYPPSTEKAKYYQRGGSLYYFSNTSDIQIVEQ